ncbi:MAG: hypothetical protein GXY07_07050 [Candidatus Hydrogenedentes bacterium]|nr:hypothetical protein [Candidatus Hydrogenedentota bacterium]
MNMAYRAGLKCEETDETSLCVLISPRTLGNVVEALNIPKKETGKSAYGLSSRRASYPEFFEYGDSREGETNCIIEHAIGFGTHENGLMMTWSSLSNKSCVNKKFSFPNSTTSREMYIDMNGDGIVDLRRIRINDINYPEILFDNTWLAVDKWYGEDKEGAFIEIDGKCQQVLFDSGKWTLDNSFENNGSWGDMNPCIQ